MCVNPRLRRQLGLLGALSPSACIVGIDPDYDYDHIGGEFVGSESTDATDSSATVLEVPANFIACRGPGEFDPAQCSEYANKKDTLVIDLDSDVGMLVACGIFVLDDALLDKTVLDVELELHTSGGMSSASTTSGEIWAVEPFTPADFELSLPVKLGDSPLAPNPGPAVNSQPMRWELPIEIAVANTQLHLCVYPVSDDDVRFDSHQSNHPPVLRIEFE